MSLADMTIVPAGAPGGAKTGGGSAPSRTAIPAGPPIVMRDGRFSAADGVDAAPMVRRDGGGQATPPPKGAAEILKRFGATWAQDPVPAATAEPAAKPVEESPAAAATAPAAGDSAAPAGAVPGEAAKDPKEASKPEATPPSPPDEYRATFGERKAADVKAELDRIVEHNRRLAADLETARKAPPPPADDAGAYIDDSVADTRRRIARALGIDDPQHADVTKELQDLTLELNAAVFGASLDAAQQAKRDAAKARQALARDKKTRTAQGDSTTSSEEAAAKQATEFIGNRLSAPRSGPDGKALPSLREQFPLAAAMAQRSGTPLEAQIFDVYRRELATGRFDPARMHDDDYLISEAGKLLESHYQDLADALGKARTPSTATPPATPPAPAPAAATSASQGPPQGHGGRTALTAADSSATPPTPPAPPVARTAKRMSRDELYAKYYPKS